MEDPLIYLMHTQMENYLNKLAVKFTRPEKAMEHKKKFRTLKALNISLENQKADENLLVGLVTRGKLKSLLSEGDIDSRDVYKSYDGVRRFYIAAYTSCSKWLPLNNPLLKNCVLVDFKKRNKCSMDNLGVLSSREHIHRGDQ